MPSLKPGRATAHAWRCAIPAVHTLGVAKRRTAMLTHVPFRTLANFITIAPSLVSALLITFRIGVPLGALLAQLQTQRGTVQGLALPTLDEQPYGKSRYARIVPQAR